jgi:hypothetical protein
MAPAGAALDSPDRRGLEWWMNLLTTYTHDSELQGITAPLLIFTIHKSPQHPLSHFQPVMSSPSGSTLPRVGARRKKRNVFTSSSLATASNSADSSASRAQVPSSQPPMQNSNLTWLYCMLITSLHGPCRSKPFPTITLLLRIYTPE